MKTERQFGMDIVVIEEEISMGSCEVIEVEQSIIDMFNAKMGASDEV